MSADDVSEPDRNEPEGESGIPDASGNWSGPVFVEGKTWQGPREEYRKWDIFEDTPTQDLEACKAELLKRIDPHSNLDQDLLASPKLWREVRAAVGTNGTTVAVAVFKLHEELLLNS